MPLVHIAILHGWTKVEIRAIADGVHQALVDTFDTPAEDRFQVIQRYEPDELIYNPGYLGIQRTGGIVMIHIVASKTRSTAIKQALYNAVAANLARAPGVRPEDVQIILSPNEREDWSFGNGVASYADERQA